LKYVEGLSLAEISVVLGRSPEAVNSLLQRARLAYGRIHQRLRLNERADQ
jgi:DNA-directed RNA polymerase specialized sigma24 family protein